MKKSLLLLSFIALVISILLGFSGCNSLENQNLLSDRASVRNLDVSNKIQPSELIQQSIRFKFALGYFSEGLGRFVELDNNGNRTKAEGFIDKKGRVVIKPQKNTFFGDFSEGLAYFGIGNQKEGYKYGYIDKSGKVVIEPRFDRAESFSEGLARIEIDRKWGFIDRYGEVVIEPRFDRAVKFSQGLAAVRVDGKWGFINHRGEIEIEPQFKGVPSQFSIETGALVFSEGKAAVTINSEVGSAFIDRYGKLAIDKYFGYAEKFQNGYAWVAGRNQDKDGDKISYIDSTGKFVARASDEFRTKYLSEDLEPIEVQGKFGYADTNGKIVIPPIYIWAGGFYDGFFAPVAMTNWMNKKVYGFINYSGEWIAKPTFEFITDFSEDVAMAGCPVAFNKPRLFFITKGDILRNASLNPDWCGWLKGKI